MIQFKGGQEVRVTISWSIRLPLTIPYHHFIIHVYKNSERIHSEEDVEPTKRHYEEFFDGPGHTDGDTYSVVVEAQRVDGQSVHSDRTPLKASKGTLICGMSHVCMYGFCFYYYVGTGVYFCLNRYFLYFRLLLSLQLAVLGWTCGLYSFWHRYNCSRIKFDWHQRFKHK